MLCFVGPCQDCCCTSGACALASVGRNVHIRCVRVSVKPLCCFSQLCFPGLFPCEDSGIEDARGFDSDQDTAPIEISMSTAKDHRATMSVVASDVDFEKLKANAKVGLDDEKLDVAQLQPMIRRRRSISDTSLHSTLHYEHSSGHLSAESVLKVESKPADSNTAEPASAECDFGSRPASDFSWSQSVLGRDIFDAAEAREKDLRLREDQFKERLDEAETYTDEMFLRSAVLSDTDAVPWHAAPPCRRPASIQPAAQPAASRILRVARRVQDRTAVKWSFRSWAHRTSLRLAAACRLEAHTTVRDATRRLADAFGGWATARPRTRRDCPYSDSEQAPSRREFDPSGTIAWVRSRRCAGAEPALVTEDELNRFLQRQVLRFCRARARSSAPGATRAASAAAQTHPVAVEGEGTTWPGDSDNPVKPPLLGGDPGHAPDAAHAALRAWRCAARWAVADSAAQDASGVGGARRAGRTRTWRGLRACFQGWCCASLLPRARSCSCRSNLVRSVGQRADMGGAGPSPSCGRSLGGSAARGSWSTDSTPAASEVRDSRPGSPWADSGALAMAQPGN